MINPKFVVNCHDFISADILELLLRSQHDMTELLSLDGENLMG
jgi:hypothetical protein